MLFKGSRVSSERPRVHTQKLRPINLNHGRDLKLSVPGAAFNCSPFLPSSHPSSSLTCTRFQMSLSLTALSLVDFAGPH